MAPLRCKFTPLFLYHQWQANLRILGIEEIKTVPYMPLSHPFVERLIGTIRHEFLGHVFFWNVIGLQRKLDTVLIYYCYCLRRLLLPRPMPDEYARRGSLQEILPGIYHWTTFHKGIQEDVHSYYIAAIAPAVLIDPRVPAEGLGWFAGHPLVSSEKGQEYQAIRFIEKNTSFESTRFRKESSLTSIAFIV